MGNMWKKFKSFVVIFVSFTLFSNIFVFLGTAEASQTERNVPPSIRPVDGEKARFPKEKTDITPAGVKTYKLYQEKSGVFSMVLGSNGVQEKPLSGDKTSIQPNKNLVCPTGDPGIVDNITLENRNGTVTTTVYPTSYFGVQNTSISVPPPPLVVETNTYIKYNITYSRKIKILSAYLSFDTQSISNSCGTAVGIGICDVGTAWESSTMAWGNQPGGPPVGNGLIWPAVNPPIPLLYNVTDMVRNHFYGLDDCVGFGFRVAAPGQSDCSVSGSAPALVIEFVNQEGGSPSGSDLSFGNGAGNVSVNTFTGSTYLTQYDIGFGIFGGMSLSFVRTYNSCSNVNYGMGPGWTSNYHQQMTVNSMTGNGVYRSSNGCYLEFPKNISSGWDSPEFSRLKLQIENISGTDYYVILDKFDNKLYFEYNNGAGGKLLRMTNRLGGRIDISWSQDQLSTVTDYATSRNLAFTYDQWGRLTDVIDPESKVVSFTYDGSNMLTTRTDQESKLVGYAYDLSGRLTSLTNENNQSYTFEYDTNGKITNVKDAYSAVQKSYVIGDTVTQISDPNIQTSECTFDTSGYISKIQTGSLITEYQRNSMKEVTQITDPKSHLITLVYDSSGNITSTSIEGIIQSFAFNSSNQLTLYTDAKNKNTSFEYTNNKLTKITNPLNQEIVFGYVNNKLASVTSPYGQGTATWGIAYDSNNYPNSVQSPSGKTWNYTNSATGKVSSYEDPNGNDWTYTYDSRGRLKTATDPLNNPWNFYYDNSGNLTEAKDPLNHSIYYTYDNNSRLVKVKNALNHEVEISRRSDGRINWVEDPMNKRTSYTYDTLGRVTTVTNPENEATTVAYDNNSNITSVTNPMNKTTSLQYDTHDRLTQVTNPLNKTSSFQYDNNGNLTKITNALQKETNFTYDDLNRLTQMTNALSQSWTKTYDNAGKLVQVDGPSTTAQEFSYNSDGLMASSENSDGKTQSYTYDNAGRVTRITDPMTNHCDFEYDALNRVTKAYDALGNYSQFTYDAVGNVTQVRDRRGNNWQYQYDAIYRMTQVTDPLSNVYQYTYDDNSRITEFKKPPQATPPTVGFQYDDVGRLTRATDELSHYATFSYNDNGLLTSITDRKSQTIGYTYDDLSRLTQISYPDSSTVSFNYDDLSRLTSFVDSVGTTEFTYDDIGRLTSTDDPWDFTHQFQYNAEGLITQLTAEGDARTYTWDTAGRMTQATRSSQTTSYSYNDNSWATGMDYPTGVVADYLYNANGWMTNIDVKKSDNTSILDLDYTFDNNGNVTSEKVGSDTWSYTYDALNRLTNVDKPGTTNDVVYTYDQRGNRTDIDIGGTDNTDFTFNVADRLTRVDYESTAYELFAYDNNGNCTSKEYYSGSPFVLSPSSLPSKEKLESSRVHYPHQYAPSSLRTCDLSPYLPSSYMDTATWDIATRNNKQMEDLLRKNIWLSPSSPTVDPDYVTTYEYTYENQLKQANLPTNNDTVTFQYDASGRRLKKTYTSHITIDGTPHTDVTTYKYHYAGGVITEIELDKVRDSSTTLLDQELIYHIGANSQPISFEWTRHTGTGESQTTTTSTYYYHYDVHGNTLKVTDTNQDTKITYTYDTLGNITSQTNPDSIPNPFTFMGASQTILDTETGLYFSSGYYNPQTGTLLQGTGSPAMPNPTSISTINSMSTSSLPEQQLLSHSITSATTAGSSSGGEPGSFAPTESDGLQQAGNQNPPPDGMDKNTEINAKITQDLPPHLPDMTKWAIGVPGKGSRGRMITGDVIDVISPGGVPSPNTTPLSGGVKCFRCGQEHLTIVCPCDGSDTSKCIINAESSAAPLQTDDLKLEVPESGMLPSTDNKVSQKSNSNDNKKSESEINGVGIGDILPEESSVYMFCWREFMFGWSALNKIKLVGLNMLTWGWYGGYLLCRMLYDTAILAQEFKKDFMIDDDAARREYGLISGLSDASILQCLLFEAAIEFANEKNDLEAYWKYPEEFKRYFLDRHEKDRDKKKKRVQDKDLVSTDILIRKDKKKTSSLPPLHILPAPKYPFEWTTK